MRKRIGRVISKILNPYKSNVKSQQSLYEKIQELEQRIHVLEEENVETTNVLYEIMQDIRAVDQRIDILNIENYQK